MRAEPRLARSISWVPTPVTARRFPNTEHEPGMCESPTERPRAEAIDRLETLGLSVYAARTFVALVALGTGTAKSVSETVDVPRTRVYDAVEELDEWGLVSVEETTPKQFRSVTPETASELFDREYTGRITALERALTAVESGSE